MFKNFKSVSMLLFLSAIGGGTVYAVSGESVTGIDAIQQKGTCTGIVKDATGEPIIGATVMVKGTTNGTITGLDGDFSLNNVEKEVSYRFLSWDIKLWKLHGKEPL